MIVVAVVGETIDEKDVVEVVDEVVDVVVVIVVVVVVANTSDEKFLDPFLHIVLVTQSSLHCNQRSTH